MFSLVISLSSRSSHRRLFVKKGVLKRPATSFKRDSNIGVSCEICEIFKGAYFEEDLRTSIIKQAGLIFLYNCNYNNCSCNCECLVYIYSLVAFNVYTLKNDKKKLQIKKKKKDLRTTAPTSSKNDTFRSRKQKFSSVISMVKCKYLRNLRVH